MILIVGLGNPGEKYQFTRHNVGFEIIDSFHSYFKFPEYKSKFDGLFSDKKLFGQKIIIFKPQIFMNLSGNPIKKIRDYFKITNTSDIILIHDDIDMEFLKLRVKTNGGHGGHNGVRDIIDAIGGKKNFFRLRIGVGHPGHKSMVANYVLSDPSRAEADAIMSNIEDAIRVVPKTVTGDWEEAMKFLHSN